MQCYRSGKGCIWVELERTAKEAGPGEKLTVKGDMNEKLLNQS